ncbi:alpha/beta hydrolase family protein [Mariniblastus fucicola]|uniref:Alpha/beta hydrolase family protein n=1 Tax=Mariniblastus fucicola TaxID=980251 RepID=A0A5B9P4I9_9BACT|nr:alpha/beta fold hydrolase [Mariniblastus fucicola]QEG21288.1 Alpha/beta hydrolase family protein [Mariniblastus fucicola]
MPVRRVQFDSVSAGAAPTSLAGIFDLPDESPVATAVFAHCFTCTKDIKAIARISRLLSRHGIAVLRFDFRGLGGSKGVFADSNFLTNQDDIRAAVAFMSNEIAPPQLLIGHSLGGAAMMATAPEFQSARGLVTLAAPSDTTHLVQTLLRLNPAIGTEGQGDVVIGGMTHHVKQQMLDVLQNFDLPAAIKKLTLPHLIFHSKVDQTVAIEHAHNLQDWTGGPNLLITLGDSDHLFIENPGDVRMIADFIQAWFSGLPADG